jgi:hypothetical protein
MSKNKLLLLLIATLFFATGAQATTCATTTMAALISSGGCTIGDLLFTFGNGAYIFSKDDINVTASQVVVTPTGTGLVGSQTGFIFTTTNNGWVANNPDVSGNGNSADINVTFDATVIPAGFKINSTTLAIGPVITGEAGSTGMLAGESITDIASSHNFGNINLTIIGNNDAQSIGNGGTALSQTAFGLSSGVNINKDIAILSLDGPPSSAEVHSLTETFTIVSVPEPGAFVLAGLGIAFVFFRRWRKIFTGSALALALMVIGSNSAQAAGACVDGNSLAQYITQASCTITGSDGLFTFSASSLTASGTGTLPAASGIVVNAIFDPVNHRVGFQFTPNAPIPKTVGTQSVLFTISFTVKETFDTITAFNAGATVTTAGTGTFAGSSATITTLGSVSGFPTSGTSASGSVPAGTTLTITDTFNMSSTGSGLSNSTHVSNVTDTVTEVPVSTPEPLSTLLVSGGLIGLSLMMKKSQRSRK